MSSMSKAAFSEVIESNLHGFLAQSWQWNTFPAFGSLVTIEDKKRIIFGIVYQVQTGSMDPVRYPFPYQKTYDELIKEQPQIFEFLKTTFSCVTVGFADRGSIFYQLPPEPANIHAFVGTASSELSKQFFYQNNYLHMLFAAVQITNLDELLLAILRQHATLGILKKEKIGAFMNIYSLLTANDYRRMKLFLQRVEPMIV